jgi:hypothetical protein
VAFVGAIALHAMRVFFTGAFRKPRDINWLVGISLLLLGMAAGFTGYSLPDDLLSGTGLRIAYSAVLSIPFVGPWIAYLIFGGEFPTHEMLSRLFVFHVFLLPALIAGALGTHLALVWHQKHTQFRGVGRTEENVVGSSLWPRYTLKSLGLFFVIGGVLAMLGGLFQINPIWFYGPFDPSIPTSPAQPDWYVGWLEGALRLAVHRAAYHRRSRAAQPAGPPARQPAPQRGRRGGADVHRAAHARGKQRPARVPVPGLRRGDERRHARPALRRAGRERADHVRHLPRAAEPRVPSRRSPPARRARPERRGRIRHRAGRGGLTRRFRA